MDHSIQFVVDTKASNGTVTTTTYHTWNDWGLIPSSRPLVNPPSVNTKYVEIPGKSGAVDLSEYISNEITYTNRTGQWQFIVDWNEKRENNKKEYIWYERYSKILQALHGKTAKVTLLDDPTHYYKGRVSVNSWKSSAQYSTITLDYNLEPYKYDSSGGKSL